MPVVSIIHSSIGAHCAFNDLIAVLHLVFALSNVNIFFINKYLVSGSDMALFTAEPNLCKNSVKAFAEPCIILVNEVDFFSQILSHFTSSERSNMALLNYNIIILDLLLKDSIEPFNKQLFFSNINSFSLFSSLLLYILF